MKKIQADRREKSQNFIAVAVTAMILISSIAIINIATTGRSENTTKSNIVNQPYQIHPCKVTSILADGGVWISFDSTVPGTPAEAHVTISDTSGITVVADFHGFWRNNNTVNGTMFDGLEMPGAGSIQSPGLPVLPCLFERVEIPHDVDISIEVLASSTDTTSGYNITPAIGEDLPTPIKRDLNDSLETIPPFNLNPVYSNNTFFPGSPTSTEGGRSATSLMMRGHRLLGLSFYPVQFNPVTTTLLVYSQIVVKVKYSFPAQIQPVPERLRSAVFDNILRETVLNYGLCNSQYSALSAVGTTSVALAQEYQGGDAEYLIVTTSKFKEPADSLAEWKNRKGVPSEVITVPANNRDAVKRAIREAYESGNPPPTYVLLLGDVEDIPATYDSLHWSYSLFIPFENYIASDLGYFNIDDEGYVPDMIYGRISVDTVEQAWIIVNKILAYEQSPPSDESFYNNAFFAGEFYDRKKMDAVEDSPYPFLSALERIRQYLKNEYAVHINYSCSYLHYDRRSDGYDASLYTSHPANKFLEDLEFYSSPLSGSNLVSDSIYPDIPNFEWLPGYDSYYDLEGSDNPFYQLARGNITPNINEGRFLVLYYGHGGSMNMVRPTTLFLSQERGSIEGWQHPFFNTSYVSDLVNGGETPLIINIACSTGWFDGERDGEEGHNYIGDDPLGLTGDNLFAGYESECFAENITRLENGGAIAVIASSRPAYAAISAQLMDGLIQAFWPGFLGSTNQPIYEMGAALIFGKLYALGRWNELRSDTLWGFKELMYPLHKVETTLAEFQLFGDPETQLWTDTPIPIDVSYPDLVGTASHQKFAVTVNNSETGEPISFARVCIQQGAGDVYEVKYTDSKGQAVFDVNPSADYSHMNLTVTKHNVRPNITTIDVIDSEAIISLSPNPVMEEETLTITFNQYLTDTSKEVFIEGTSVASLPPGTPEFQWQVWSGPTQYLNVKVESSIGTAVNCFQRVSSDEGPDPWIESLTTQAILATGVWHNPDIAIYHNGEIVDSMTQNEVYDIVVTVHNNGIIDADSTTVTLSYSAFGGGVSWTPTEPEATVSPTQDRTDTATFQFTPILANGVCLRVDLFHPGERDENKLNNIGYENVYVIQVCSPGMGAFYVGNPTNTSGYAFIKVTQLGNYDIWNTSILGYSQHAISAGASEGVALFLDPLSAPNRTRIFRVDIFVKCMFVGGLIFKSTPGDLTLLWIITGGLVLAVIVLLELIRRERR